MEGLGHWKREGSMNSDNGLPFPRGSRDLTIGAGGRDAFVEAENAGLKPDPNAIRGESDRG